jgi:hypothetical protein
VCGNKLPEILLQESGTGEQLAELVPYTSGIQRAQFIFPLTFNPVMVIYHGERFSRMLKSST